MTPRPRPVADTNVVVSGLYGSGAPAVLLNLHNGGRLTVVVSRQVLGGASDEMRRKRPSLLEELEAFLGDTPPEKVRSVPGRIDRRDASILAAAIKSDVDRLAGGNTGPFIPTGGGRTPASRSWAGPGRGNPRPVAANDVDGG